MVKEKNLSRIFLNLGIVAQTGDDQGAYHEFPNIIS